MDGTIVQFSCVVVAEEINYFINDTATNDPNIAEAGFIESKVDILNITTLRLNLTATASSQYNNTKVYCRGFNPVHLSLKESEVAVLLIQGKLLLLHILVIC